MAEALYNEREYLHLLEPPSVEVGVGRWRRLQTRASLTVHWALVWLAWWLSIVTLMRWLTPTALRVAGVLVAIGGALVAALGQHDEWLWIPVGVLVILLTVEARTSGQRRVIIGHFDDLQAAPSEGAGSGAADLLRVELARLGDLFQTVEDKRAIPSGLGPKRSLDATLSVETVASSLQAAVSAESRIGFGPLSLPARFVIAAADRVVRPPRIDGAVHGTAADRVVTAQLDGQSRLSWRVPVEVTEHHHDAADRERYGHDLFQELALRIFTDLALGRSVRWQASREFVHGLDRVRACLRSPTDRKVNLRYAESHFLKTLSEDEDFPHAYYNLGVVYHELFTLTWANGRQGEARNHLHAAERTFEKAVERDPTRWENYFALGQTYFQHQRFLDVDKLCDRMLDLLPRRSMTARAKVHELRASALLAQGALAESEQAARRAVWRSLWAIVATRLLAGYRNNRDELAGACLQTLGLVYSSLQSSTGSSSRPWRLARAIYHRAQTLSTQRAELHLELGLTALGAGNATLALSELSVSRHSDPARPLFLAAYAAALAQSPEPRAEAPKDLCIQAARAMCRSFSPSRDRATCELITRTAERLDDNELTTIAHELTAAAEVAARRLSALPRPSASDLEEDVDAAQKAKVEREIERDRGAIVSAALLQAVGPAPISELIFDEYGREVWSAQQTLQRLRYHRIGSGPEQKAAAERQRTALTAAEKATAINPLSVLAWMTLGDVHQEYADFANARRAWLNALTQDPDNPALYDRLGTSWWHLAFQGRSRPSTDGLKKARDFFEKALVLYDSGSVEEQLHTRYRLAKLYASQYEFDLALEQLQIVEAADARPPIVGWVLLGLAYLTRRDYSECEYYFGRVVECGVELDRPGTKTKRLDDNGIDPEMHSDDRGSSVIGDRIDERLWPLGIVRAWGYLGLAFSYVERDGDLAKARRLAETARQLVESTKLDLSLTPTRIPAACDDCLGSIAWKEGDLQSAEERLEKAIKRHPYSRSYINLAHIQIDVGRTFPNSRAQAYSRAERCIEHARRLDPEHEMTDEMKNILASASNN